MSDLAISVENLGKRYRIGARRERHTHLSYALMDFLKTPLRRLRQIGHEPPANETLWALRGASFEVKQGEVVGIVGRNGAGKSTLLKILSRVVAPTEGKVELHGQVASLLEAGTGFHPELTGRENIFLNGSILGMKKKEVQSRFDEIVSFAGVEKFLDTPVKRYSSGMILRLGFAVAAHLQPEIILVDEVLAVGDVEFQKKCLGKMETVSESGRTVLFVSHQLNAIRKLCKTSLWIDSGSIQMYGPTEKVLAAYQMTALGKLAHAEREEAPTQAMRFLSWEIVGASAGSTTLSDEGPLTVKFTASVNRPIVNATHGMALWNENNQLVWGWAVYNIDLEPGLNDFVYSLPALPLMPGIYFFDLSLWGDSGLLYDRWSCVPELIIATSPYTQQRDEYAGILNLPCDFRIETK